MALTDAEAAVLNATQPRGWLIVEQHGPDEWYAIRPRRVIHKNGPAFLASGMGWEGDPDALWEAWASEHAVPRVRLAAVARHWSDDASRIDWRSLAHVTQRPVASVFFALDATIERIDWVDPATAQPVDPYGERVTGDILVREERTETEGALGPASRSYSFTTYRTDETIAQEWTTPVEVYPPAIQAERGQQRRDRAIQRVSSWLAAALGGVPQLQAWIAPHGEALAAFRELAAPGPLIAAVNADASPELQAQISTLGIHLVTDLDPSTTLKDALLAVLARWA